MPEQNPEQPKVNRIDKVALVTFWVICIFATVFVLFMFFVQAVTGAFTPPPTGGGNIDQWCKPGIPTRIQRPAFVSNDLKFVFTMHGTCKLGVYDMRDERISLLSPPAKTAAYDVTPHPLTDSIAFVLARQSEADVIDYQLATSRIDGSGLTVLTSSDTRKRFPSYSPDGRRIIFEASEPCHPGSKKHCFADIYVFDLDSKKEMRVSKFNVLQAGPAFVLSDNKKIVTPLIGDSHLQGANNRGAENEVVIVDPDQFDQFERLDVKTPTASSPQVLPTGGIAFMSRVNEYEKSQSSSFIYDVFVWSPAGTKRLTAIKSYLWDYAVTRSEKSVLLLAETTTKSSGCGLQLWNVSAGEGRSLKCEVNAREFALTP